MGTETVNKQETLFWKTIREDFPIFSCKPQEHSFIYFDNGATTQKPQCVLDSLNQFYREYNSNVHRGVHTLSQRATEAYENARETVRRFIHAEKAEEIIFTSGTTDSINLVATVLSRGIIKKGDEIVISLLEHHSNIVPWQILCETTGATLKVIPITEKGEWVENWQDYISPQTRLVAMAHVSNTLGTINPVHEVVAYCNQRGIMTLIDGAQAMLHHPVNVQEIACTFYAFSGHKMLAPTGIGVLYGKYEVLKTLPPYKGGGDMIQEVTLSRSTYQDPPLRFEAGTPPIAQAIGLAAAVDYIENIGIHHIHERDQYLRELLENELMALEAEKIKIIGSSRHKIATISFIAEGAHPYDIGILLNSQGIAVRTGHHCTQPLMEFYRIPGTVRASLAFYNTEEEIYAFVKALKKAIEMLH